MAKQSGGTSSAGGSTPVGRIATIRIDKVHGVPETRITNRAPIARLAQEWTYLLRVRSRWVENADLRKSIAERAVKDLASLGVSSDRLRDLAKARRIEIELHDWDRSDPDVCKIHEAACEIPWEYLLSAGTRAEGRYHSTLISRLFNNGLPQITPHPPKSVLFVESAPGRFKSTYEFEDEEKRISIAVGEANRRNREHYWKVLESPEKTELFDETHNPKQVWEAIHVTGLDTHQAGWWIDDFYADMKEQNESLFNSLLDSTQRLRDGVILREGREAELPVLYDELAGLLVGPTPPRIVTLNLYYSGARIARELVRNKAHVALGFLDEIDDELAELFFQEFYWNWCHPTKEEILSIPQAFVKAWEAMPSDTVHGTSIVIWMGRSVFEPGSESLRRGAPPSSAKTKKPRRKARAA